MLAHDNLRYLYDSSKEMILFFAGGQGQHVSRVVTENEHLYIPLTYVPLHALFYTLYTSEFFLIPELFCRIMVLSFRSVVSSYSLHSQKPLSYEQNFKLYVERL
jgi:hypothetical protein